MRLEFEDVQSGTVYSVGPEGAVLGRERARTDIAFRDESISKRHARIFLDGGRWLIEDLESSNGTTVRNERIFQPVALSSGVVFSLAQRRFRVVAFGEREADTDRSSRSRSSWATAIPQAILHYVATLPRLFFLPVGVVRESVEEPRPPGRGPVELAIFGAVGGTLAGAWTPFFRAAMRYVEDGRVAAPSADSVLWGAGIGLAAGFVAEPAIRVAVRGLGGGSDRDARSRMTLLAFSFAALAGLPLAATRTLSPLDPPLVAGVGALVGVWLSAMALFAAFRWARALGVHRAAEIALLAIGLVLMAGGSASALRSLWSLSARSEIATDGSGPLNVPAAVVGVEEVRPQPTSFGDYARERGFIEATFDAHPSLLDDPELRAAYEKLLREEAESDARIVDSRQSEPWYREHILPRLRSARRFETTRDSVFALARRLRRHLRAGD